MGAGRRGAPAGVGRDGQAGGGGHGPRARATAFTLLEMLVVIAIASVLLALATTGLLRMRRGAQSMKCLANQRDMALAFQVFADGTFGEDRGRSNRCANTEFYIEDFVEKLYKVDEFWESAQRVPQPLTAGDRVVVCPAAPQSLTRHPDRPCNDGAVLPFENVSYAFNRRLYAETMLFEGRKVFNPRTKVNTRILDHPTVPLVFDGDGDAAQRLRRRPYFSAPPVAGLDDLYADGSWWFPSGRHAGRTNVIFVGGHALSSESPAAEADWNWRYQPNPMP